MSRQFRQVNSCSSESNIEDIDLEANAILTMQDCIITVVSVTVSVIVHHLKVLFTLILSNNEVSAPFLKHPLSNWSIHVCILLWGTKSKLAPLLGYNLNHKYTIVKSNHDSTFAVVLFALGRVSVKFKRKTQARTKHMSHHMFAKTFCITGILFN